MSFILFFRNKNINLDVILAMAEPLCGYDPVTNILMTKITFDVSLKFNYRVLYREPLHMNIE